jgi:hypothetical protein
VLINIVEKNYPLFENVFETDVNTVVSSLRKLNRARRLPSHSAPETAEKWTDDDFNEFRDAISWLEAILENYD